MTTTSAEAAAIARLADIRRILAEDREAFRLRVHEGAVAVSSARPDPDGPPPARPVNMHPGPDFYPPEAA